MSSSRLFIVHGYTANPHSHWFDWLKNTAETAGMNVSVPALPDSDHPQDEAWQAALAEAVGEIDSHTWFVGHSLGCITTLRYLNQQPVGKTAAGVILVAGFSEPLPTLPELNSFMSTPLDASRIMQDVPHRAVIASLNDEVVFPQLSLRLSQQLNAPFYALPDCGHFLARHGITELPLVMQLLQQFRGTPQNP